MTTPWTPEIPIDEALVRRQLAPHGARLDLDTLGYLASGWDHAVWATAAYVFRFPHQHEAATLAARTADRMRGLAARLPVAIPCPEWVGEASDGYPAQYVAYRRLPGELPADRPLTPDDRFRAAVPLAQLLRTLHDQPIPNDLAGSERPSDLQVRTENAQLRAEQLASGPFAGLARRAADRMQDTPSPGGGCVLIHGDLHAGQLLFDKAHELSAVLDWDELRAGDPTFDLALVYSFLPPAGRRAFFDIYGAVDGLPRARHVALSYGLAILAQAVVGEQPHLVREAAFGLENALQDGSDVEGLGVRDPAAG